MVDFSTLLGAPPAEWKPNEVLQMAKVHEVVKIALRDRADAGGKLAANEEAYLPEDSVLRSKNGEGKMPANGPFNDYDAFVRTKDPHHWQSYFAETGHDSYLRSIARALLEHVCSAQSQNLRVRHGSVPLGSCLRVKREHITPLALTLHDLKLWAVNWLRTADVNDGSTYKEIGRYVEYVRLLRVRNVWLSPAWPLRSGMRHASIRSFDNLMSTTQEQLQRAQAYAHRCFLGRMSREKLDRLRKLLKGVLCKEMEVISGLFSLKKNLANPAAYRLQPTDLQDSWANQSFVDYENMATVLLSAMCDVPLFRGALEGDFDVDGVRQVVQENIDTWPAPCLFVDAGEGGDLIPEVYNVRSAHVREQLAAVNRFAKVPLTGPNMLSQLRTAFPNDDGNITLLVQSLLRCLAALENLAPPIYMVHKLHSLAGQGGDHVLFDMLRNECISIMRETQAKVNMVQKTNRELMDLFGQLARQYEDDDNQRRQNGGAARDPPHWVTNYESIRNRQNPLWQDLLVTLDNEMYGFVRDAWNYKGRRDDLRDAVEALREICGKFAPTNPGDFDGTLDPAHWRELNNNRRGQGEPEAPEEGQVAGAA